MLRDNNNMIGTLKNIIIFLILRTSVIIRVGLFGDWTTTAIREKPAKALDVCF